MSKFLKTRHCVSFAKKERYASADQPVSAETKQVNEDGGLKTAG
jgi:hypothetical protein